MKMSGIKQTMNLCVSVSIEQKELKSENVPLLALAAVKGKYRIWTPYFDFIFSQAPC